MPNLISRRRQRLPQGWRISEGKSARGLLEIDGGEDCFIVDSKPIEGVQASPFQAMRHGTRRHQPQTSYGSAPRRGSSTTLQLTGDGTARVPLLRHHQHSVHDINYLNDIKLEYHDCGIIGDKGYLSAEVHGTCSRRPTSASVVLALQPEERQAFPSHIPKGAQASSHFSQLCASSSSSETTPKPFHGSLPRESS